MIVFRAHDHADALDRVVPEAAACDDATRGALLRFAELVSEWGRKTDLVAASSVEQLLEVLFVDAFVVHGLLPDVAGTWLDVGAGAGAPTLPLALLHPARHVRLRELRRRRLAFMRHAAGALKVMPRTTVEPARANERPEGGCDVLISRATFAPAEWLAYAAGLGERCVVLLRDQAPPSHPAWTAAEERSYALPSGSPRRAVVYRAVSPE